MNFINEKEIVEFVKNENGILLTRDYSNIKEVDFNKYTKKVLVCLTGYEQIIKLFFSVIINKINCSIILITLETDGFKIINEYLKHDKLKRWFTWNKSVNHEKVVALPIGLNYYRQYEILNKFLEKHKGKRKEKLLGINFSPHTNKVRQELIKNAQTKWKSFCDILEIKKPKNIYYRKSIVDGKIKIEETNIKYYEEISNFKFVLSPPGAGLDCHRTWEALYMDCIPIVEKSSISELYKDLPIIVVNNWNEINENFLINKYNEITNNKKNGIYNMEKIKLSYWLNKIKVENTYKTLINYANLSHYKSQKLNSMSGIKFGFDKVYSYGVNDIDNNFKEKNKIILNSRRGAGYWLWKPYFILKTLKEKIKENEYLIYSDSGAMFTKSWTPVFELMEKLKLDIGCFEIIQVEKMWTKRDLFIKMGIDEKKYTDSFQRMASYQIIKKTDFTLKFYDEYLKLCCDVNNITDIPSKNPNYRIFKDHRHDQSIFSLLTKKYNIQCLRDPCQWRFEGENGVSKAPGDYGEIINHHRQNK